MAVNVSATMSVSARMVTVVPLVILVRYISSLSRQGGYSPVLVTSGYCSSTEMDSATPFSTISFGSGTSAFSSQSLSTFGLTTTYTQVSSGIPTDGQMALVNAVPANNGVWLEGARDHTTDVSNEGYMLLVNGNTASGQFGNITLSGFTVGAYSRVTLYVANIVTSGQNLAKPDLTFDLYSTGSGNSLAARVGTGPMSETSSLTWQQVDLSFVAPTSSLILVIRSNVETATSGIDFVLDDIQSRTCPPRPSLGD